MPFIFLRSLKMSNTNTDVKKFFDTSSLAANSEFSSRLIATAVVAVAGATLYNTHKKDVDTDSVKSPKWFIKNTTIMTVIWIVFFVVFSWSWYKASQCTDGRTRTLMNFLFGAALVGIFCWQIALFGTEDSLDRRLKNSRYFVLFAAIALLLAGVYMWRYNKTGAAAIVLLAAWLFYMSAGLFNTKVRCDSESESERESESEESERERRRAPRSDDRRRGLRSESDRSE